MDTTKQRLLVFYSLLGIVLVAVLIFLGIYFADGTLTIATSNASNTIVLQENSPHPHPIDVKQTGVATSVRLEPGNYTVTIKNAESSSMQVVNLGIAEHKTVTLNPSVITPVTSNITPVTSLGASSFIASPDKLTFVDRNDPDAPLYSVDSSNHVTQIDAAHTYQSIHWADANFGIGLVVKGAARVGLVKIENSSISDIVLPFSEDSTIGYSVAPNHTWYVSDTHAVYRANGDGSFTKIYTSNDLIRLGTASNKYIQIMQQPVNSTRVQSIAIISTTGTKYQIGGELYEAAWSPSGDKLVISGDEVNGVFDVQLKKLSGLPVSNTISPVWLDDTTLLYILQNDIWSFNTSTGQSLKIASMDPSVGGLTMIEPSTDRSTIYVTADRPGYANTTYSLYRFNLENQPPANDPTTAESMSLIFPHTDTACRVNFMNFTTTSVVVKPITTKQDCIGFAKQDLIESKVLDSNEVSFLNFQNLQ